MNTVLRTLGGAVGAQIAATVIASHTAHGLPTKTGFTTSFLMASGFLLVCVFAGALVPGGMEVPTGAMALGVPAKLRLDSVDREEIAEGARSYTNRALRYRRELRRID